jgi:hypothetical protein
MFEVGSRYAKTPVQKLTVSEQDGTTRELRYVSRRFVPPVESITKIAEHHVAQGERLDNLASQYLGDPLQFWRLCDANVVLSPLELTEETGRVFDIGLPEA